MNALIRISRRLAKNDAGVTAIEYAALGALIALAIIGSLTAVGVSFERQFQTIADAFPSITPSDTDQVVPGGNPGGSPGTSPGPGPGTTAGPGPGTTAGPGPGTMAGPGPGTATVPGSSPPVPANPPVAAGNPPSSDANGPSGTENDGPFVNSDGHLIADTANKWSGNAGQGGGSGNLGRSGATRVWSGIAGADVSEPMASTRVTSHVSEAKLDERGTEGGGAERRSTTAPHPVQTAAALPGNASAATDGGTARSSVPVGANTALDPLPARKANAGIAESGSSRWGVVILLLLVFAGVFAIRCLVQRANAARASSGDLRSTSGARAQREGLVIAPIRRTK